MSPRYQPIPAFVSSRTCALENPLELLREDVDSDLERDAPRRSLRQGQQLLPPYDLDPRFRMKAPSPFVRAALLAFILFLFWVAFRMRKTAWVAGGMGLSKPEPEVDSSY